MIDFNESLCLDAQCLCAFSATHFQISADIHKVDVMDNGVKNIKVVLKTYS